MLEYQEMDPREWKECALLAAAAFYDKEWIIPYAKERGAETLSLFTNSELNKKFYVKNGFSEFDEKQFRHEGKTIGSWSYVMRF